MKQCKVVEKVCIAECMFTLPTPKLTSSSTQALYPGGLMVISMMEAEMRTMRQRGETYFHR